MAYTAEEFERCRNEAAFTTWNDGEEMIIRAALAIASAVMRPGVIEGVLRVDGATSGCRALGDVPPVANDYGVFARAIRAALTDVKP